MSTCPVNSSFSHSALQLGAQCPLCFNVRTSDNGEGSRYNAIVIEDTPSPNPARTLGNVQVKPSRITDQFLHKNEVNLQRRGVIQTIRTKAEGNIDNPLSTNWRVEIKLIVRTLEFNDFGEPCTADINPYC